VFCVATTHYSDLKLYAHSAPRVENASVEFDVQTLSPTYRLLVGLPGRSSALDIAARLGIPRVILERARSVVDPADIEASELLDLIQQERQMAEETRHKAEQERQAAARARASLEEELAEQQRSRQKVWEEAEQASRQELAALGREVAALRAQAERIREDQMAGTAPDSAVSGQEGGTEAAVAPPVAERGKQAIEQLAARAEALESIARPPELRAPSRPAEASAAEAEHSLVLGAPVLVPSLGLSGSVTRLDDEEAEVDVHGMRVRLKRAELQMAPASALDPDRARPRSREYESASVVVLKDRERPVALQLDLRGQRREEATQELDRYLNDAYLAGLKTVRVIHGKGTGVVRRAVHELLGSHTLVRRYAAAPREAGGDGATEVELVG
jgi:DNA mismatch repair protein MutS2